MFVFTKETVLPVVKIYSTHKRINFPSCHQEYD